MTGMCPLIAGFSIGILVVAVDFPLWIITPLMTSTGYISRNAVSDMLTKCLWLPRSSMMPPPPSPSAVEQLFRNWHSPFLSPSKNSCTLPGKANY